MLAALEPYVSRGVPVVGLEPSCLLTFRDEVPAMIKAERRGAACRPRAACSRSFWRARRSRTA